jgi:uncharacterized protein
MGLAVIINPGEGVNGHINALGHEPHRYTIFYVPVDNVPTYLDQAAALGGKTLAPVDISYGTFAWMQDPEGNTIGLFKRSM